MKSTSDVYFAAALLSFNYRLTRVDRKDPRHMVFEFGGINTSNLGTIQEATVQENLDALETQWANRELTVNAFDFAEAIKRMKSTIHSN